MTPKKVYRLRVEDHSQHPHRNVSALFGEDTDRSFSTTQEASLAARELHQRLPPGRVAVPYLID